MFQTLRFSTSYVNQDVGQRIFRSADFPGGWGLEFDRIVLPFHMDLIDILREILPVEIVDNFDLVRYEKTSSRFDLWFDEKKIQSDTDACNANLVSNGFGDYKCIQDYPLLGRLTHLYLRKRKWIDRETGNIFSYSLDISEYKGTRLNAEFVTFLKGDS